MKELHEIRANIVREHGGDIDKLDAYYESLRFPGFTYGIPGRIFQTDDEIDEYVKEKNRDFERRRTQKAAADGECPPEPR